MGVSALRVAACAGVLVGGLMLGTSAAGPASADTPGWGHLRRDGQSGKGVEHLGRPHGILGAVGEWRKRHHPGESSPAPTTFGAARESEVTASESTATTFGEVTDPPAPDLAPGDDREASPEAPDVGTEGAVPGGETEENNSGETDADSLNNAEVGGEGSDYTTTTPAGDNTAVTSPEPAPEPETVKASTGVVVDYPFLYYLLEVRRGGGGWWNATRIISRFEEIINPPPPEPEPMPAPAFRGPAPEAPAPEPVIDVSGGVGGGGSDYQPTDFGGAPVLRAPVIAVPLLPPAAARFPSIPTVGAAVGADSVVARGVGVELGSPNSAARTEGAQAAPAAGTLKSMAGETPRQQGYATYLRSPGLPQMAGAALPGVAGILLMTLGGSVIGYRQANAGRMVRMTSAARYLP
jgi:hypothetical protein